MDMDEEISALTYAVRMRVIVKYLGQLGVMLALLTMAPLVASLVFGEYAQRGRYLLVIAILLILSIPTVRLPTPTHIQTNEALRNKRNKGSAIAIRQ